MRFLLDSAHESLFCPAVLRLGEIHWYVLRAAQVMEARCYLEPRKGGMFITSPERTDFGKEVALDEINWWIFKKEKDVNALREKTEHTLNAVQVLKEHSVELQRDSPKSYDSLISTLRRFAEGHVDQIEVLYDYVRWLEARDILAPHILYTYRVWGSTRRSNCWSEVDTDVDEPVPEIVPLLAQKILGLHSRFYTFDLAYMDVGYEVWQTFEGSEDDARGEEFEIPAQRVVTRAAREAYDLCATYFTCIRDSLRNILLEIDKFFEQHDLIYSDQFWRKFVLAVVGTPKTETLLWDLKKTLTLWHVTETSEKQKAKVTLAEDVASLANGKGGALVIGVTNAREIVGIDGTPKQIEDRLKVARQCIARHVEYDRDLVSFRQIPVPCEHLDRICIVIVVAQGCEVASVHDGNGHYTYPVRRETGIERVSRDSLASDKRHMKSDNHDFMRDLNRFVTENS